jgi:hypothetical protein
MTPLIGFGSNATNLYYFSTCSINQFKEFLLTTDLRQACFYIHYYSWVLWDNFLSNVSSNASCLANVPTTFESFFKTEKLYSSSTVFLGKLYSLDQQCKLIYGSFSHYCNGVRIIIE